jgi:hypothetical protein
MGSTRPRSEISPVIATSPRSGTPVSALTRAAAMVIPALGPSWASRRRAGARARRSPGRTPGRCQRAGARAHPAHGGAGALLHHVAERAGELHAPPARDHAHLDLEQLAAGGRVGEPVGHPDLVLEHRVVVLERRRAQERRQLLGAHDRRPRDRSRRAAAPPLRAGAAGRWPVARLERTPRQLARHLPDAPLELAHPGLARPPAHHGGQRAGLPHRGVGREPRPPELPRPQVPLGDGQLLRLQVPGDAHHLHAVAQRLGHLAQRVGGGDEQHPRQVVVELEEVVAERVLLLGVEHLEQRRRRVAAPVAPHLVDLVEQQHRVGHARLAHRLQHAPRLRPHVRAPVPAHLGLVAHPAERDARERPPQRPRHRPRQRRLAHPRRPDEAQHRRPRLGVGRRSVRRRAVRRVGRAGPGPRRAASASTAR